MAKAILCRLSITVVYLIFTLCKKSFAQHSGGLNENRYGQTLLGNHHKTTSKVDLKIYYETHCPYTIKFFKEQLAPAVERLASHLDVYLIPYGHAKTKFENGRYKIHCQHGDIECYGNKLHACALDVIQSNTRATLFNICIMDRTVDYNTLNTLVNLCGQKLNIPTSEIWECMNSERSSLLLRSYGEETRALRPRHIPFVILNGSAGDQQLITQYLGYSVCQLLTPRPYACGSGP